MKREEALLNVLAQQRDAALNQCAMLSADLQVLGERVKELEAQIAKTDADKPA